MDAQRRKLYRATKRLHAINGEGMYCVECFGDHLAEQQGYKKLSGMDAIHFYLIEKYHWLPAQVKSLNYDDLSLLLSEEMQGWTLPEEARG